MVATRKPLGPDTDIEKITDTGIQKILLKHLETYGGNKAEAFSPEGIEQLNSRISELNDGKPHQPIYKVRIAEVQGYKFSVGDSGAKANKFVEAAKGTNLIFAVYQKADGKRTYETIPLNIVIERVKQGLSVAPEVDQNGNQILFTLSPNDLVYVPSPEEMEVPLDYSKLNRERIYKMVSSSGNQCFFIPEITSSPIIQTKELGSNNKAEKSWYGEMIKEVCIPLKVDKLGNIIK